MGTDLESWKPVVDWPSYSISSRGNVIGPKGPIKIFFVKGYPTFNVASKNGKRKSLRVHREVLRAHSVGAHGLHARHLNDIRTDCRIDNLAWGTQQQNEADKFRNGRGLRGSNHHQAKIAENDVIEIIKSNEPITSLARRFGVTPSNICRIRHRKTWRHLNAA